MKPHWNRLGLALALLTILAGCTKLWQDFGNAIGG